jgi:crotonobetainyl-CoA:carnitine CoA-transferase CaiB-like acyl-CoA transferase
MNTQGAYAGLRVRDLGQGVAAPYCAMLLAVHGAEVVKLKPDAALPPAPRIGEHGAAILAEIGVDAATIASLCTENIVLIPEGP